MVWKAACSHDWAKSLFSTIGCVMRKVCSKSKVDVAQFEVLKSWFLLEIQNIDCMDSIPLALVINFKYRALNYVLLPG